MGKKILFIVPSLQMGGMERVLVTYANLFINRDYDVTVLNLTSGDTDITSFFDEKVKYFEKYTPVPHLFRARIKDIFKFNFRVLPFDKWINFHSEKYLHSKYVKEFYDIEVAFFGFTSIKIISGVSDKRTKKIGWIHGEQKENDYAPILKYDEALRIFNKIDKYVCVSEGAKNTVKKVYHKTNNLFVVNNPNDTNKIRSLALDKEDIPIKNKFTFVNASRFDDKQKGFSRLLRVCKRLKDEKFDFDLWLIGDGIDYNTITNLAQEYGLKNVYFFGQQKNPYKFIKNADMYVCSSYSEGFSIVMIETVILATPILSTDVPGAGEMLENGKYGMIVENSEDGLYAGMKEILSNKKLYNHYKDMAELRKDYLSEEVIMDELEAILER